ncbi:U-box domain-containing protein 39-like [Panicum miliaceum]|uniref:RING-type E3 ubiquitin transferase n=1 Tax=Panicum miliaceum TaxID=4540 RepID=A0A3L6TEA6_PANMI|nr:U-box domain-containing protein 39-like [Panicum miliaceum]
MGAARPRRWKLPFHRAASGGTSAPCSPSSKSSAAPAPASPARSEAWAAEAVPEEFLCPISGALMADPVILPSGKTYERACLQACAELAFSPPGGAGTMIPNSALRAAIGTWCARAGRAAPAPPSAQVAREAVLHAMPPAAAAKSVRTTARRAAVMAASSSNSSYSSPASTSSYGSSSEIVPAEEEDGGSARPVKEAPPQTRVVREVEVEAEPAPPVDPLEDEVVGKVLDADEDGIVAAAMGALREAMRESADRRRALCTPRLLGALRRVLLLPRHAAARVDAAAALVNLSLEPANKVRIVRAGAVPALVEVLRSGASAPEAREHAAGALFGLALNVDNRAAIGVLGAVPPLLDLLTSPAHPPRARRDAGMALYHLSLAAVNQSKVARFPGAPKALLAVASGAAEPGPIRRLALMVVCNVAACAEGRAALMDAGAVASVAGILDDDAGAADLEEWCVSAMYAMSRGSLRFRGLARAAGADRALRRVVADEGAGVRREMARKTLRAMRGDLDEDGEYNDLTGSSLECGDGEDCGGSIVSDGLMSFRRRQRELGVSSCGNTAEF